MTTNDWMVQVEHLTKRYGDFLAVKDISFGVRSGEILGFLGPNGAGKTTTMKMLTSYLAPTSGRAKIAGYDVFEQSIEARTRVGYLPEGNALYKDMTVLEYLGFVADLRSMPKGNVRNRRMRHVVEQCGLGDRLGFLIGELSKGLRQRVGLAQAILHEPDVLILDEPTSGLDPNQLVEIREVIREIGREKTVVFSTHIMQEVQAVCSRVLIIADGRIVADGTPEQLQQRAQGQMQVTVQFHALKGAVDPRTALLQVPGVAQVQAVALDAQAPKVEGAPRFHLTAKPGADPRAAIFHMVVEKGWVLTEMVHERASLEDVFHRLTTQTPDFKEAT